MTTESAYPRLDGAGAERLRTGPWRVVVIGAGGWLGLATLELLHGLLGQGFHQRVACFGSNARTLHLRGGLQVEQHALEALGRLSSQPSLVLHLAFLTQENVKAMPEDAYVEENRAISRRVLDALDSVGAEGLFLPSSGAVYSVGQAGAERSKRLYGSLKREDEDRFAAWGRGGGGAVVIARVFNLSGPYINKRSSYALACFIADALAGRPIRIAASRPVYRSYVAISELMSVVLGALTAAPTAPLVFDTAGVDVYEMTTIAEVVGNALGHDLGVERPALRDGDNDRYVGDGSTYGRLRRLHGVTPVGIVDQVRETARYMAECKGDLN